MKVPGAYYNKVRPSAHLNYSSVNPIQEITPIHDHDRNEDLIQPVNKKQMFEEPNEAVLVHSNIDIVISKLEQSFHQIAHIKDLAQKVAEQTNALCATSSVDAVQAVDHRKRLAAVVTEMKQLSEQTKQIATEMQNVVTASHVLMQEINANIQPTKGHTGQQQTQKEEATRIYTEMEQMISATEKHLLGIKQINVQKFVQTEQPTQINDHLPKEENK
ncbi:methyl-accepting chemotaxis protein [Microbacteriaceae bacterium 4G12]